MTWIRKTASLLVIANMVFAPLSLQAQALSPDERDAQHKQASHEHTQALEYAISQNDKGAYAFQKGQQEPDAFFPFRSEEELRQFSPKKLNQKLLIEMARVKSASGAAFSQSFRSLPAETGIFALAMGAAVATQLFANYAENPTGMMQHLEHQVSPIGVVSFYTFMYTQGVTSNILSMYLKNPAYMHMIPYLGMAVGAFAQQYLGQVLADPNVQACAKISLGSYQISDNDKAAGVSSDPCNQAYEYLVVQRKIWEFAPGIISMLTSSAIAGQIESKGAKILASQAAKNVGKKILARISSLDIITLLVPGGLEVKGLKLLLVKGMRIYLFVTIDNFLSNRINFAWKNVFDGDQLNRLNDKLVEETFQQKQNKWATDNTDLVKSVKLLHRSSSAWRMLSLADVYSAHQNWSENLQNLTGMFTASYGFYNAFIDGARAARRNPKAPLNRAYPLNGVIASGLLEGKEDLYFANPDFVEPLQAATVASVVTALKFVDQPSEKYAQLLKAATPYELKSLRNIRDLLANKDLLKEGEGLALLNSEIDRAQTTNASPEYYQILQDVYLALGEPQPLLEPGRGFSQTYEKAPASAATIANVDFKKVNGVFQTDHMTDYLLMQMICGPDAEKNEASVHDRTGFPSEFSPPQIKNPADDFSQICYASGELPTPMIYQQEVNASTRTYQGFLEYMKFNIRPSVIGGEQSNFSDWWAQKTESQMQAAFEIYKKSYNGIVANLITRLFHSPVKNAGEQSKFSQAWKSVTGFFSTEDSSFNTGPLSNTPSISIFQEARMYQVILGELLKDVYQAQNNKALPAEYFSPQMEPAVKHTDPRANGNRAGHLNTNIPMLSLLAENSTFEFDRLVQPFTLNSNVPKAAKPRGYRLQIQDDLEQALNGLNDLLKQIKVVQIDAKGNVVPATTGFRNSIQGQATQLVIQSSIENNQLEDQLQKIQIVIAKFKNLIGAGDWQANSQLATAGNEVENINKALLAAQPSLRAMQDLIMKYSMTTNTDVWTDAIKKASGAISDMQTITTTKPGSSTTPAFAVTAQMAAAQDALSGLSDLVISPVRDDDFASQWQKQVALVKTKLTSLIFAFEGGIAATKPLVKLNAQQTTLALAALENLQSIAMEMKMYGSIANAVDWQKLRNLKQMNAQEKSFQNEAQRQLEQIAGRSMFKGQ